MPDASIITGSKVAWLIGAIFAVPGVAVLRVLYDFFKVRRTAAGQAAEPAIITVVNG